MDYNVLTDMIQVYFECNKNSGRALRLYIQRFPLREVPDRRKFSRLEGSLRSFGAFRKPKLEQRRFRRDTELDVLLSVEENPRTSTREIASNIDSSQATVQKILKKHKFKPYVPQKVQAIEENDRGRRLQFCNFYLNMVAQDPLFYTKIIWSDECTFSNNGIYNRNIHRYWSQENPKIVVERNFQWRFSVNVWCGIFGNRLIGPYFINGTLNQERYSQLLNTEIVNFVDNLPLAERMAVYFQQDGATPHNARINVERLNTEFGVRWIGTNGPVRWPARSPDLTPLDFWLWGYLQDLVYFTRPENEEVLRQRIIDACHEIPPDFILNATSGIARRYGYCVQQNGGLFEQYL